ncbi:MAG: cytochrome c, partial [Solirubrobacteraceae bacterium]
MLAVAAFIAFWILVGLGIFLLAARGRNERRAAAGPSRSGSRGYIILFVVTAAVFGVGLPLLMLTGNHSKASAQVSGVKLTAAERNGRELFGQHCAVCHTLAAANAVGKVGPNLDLLRPTASIVLHTINNGCVPDPTTGSQEACLGQGVMPADVVEGDDAVDVAMFVARVTGSPTSTSTAGSSASSSASTTSSSSSTTSTSSSAAAPSAGKATTLMLAANKTGLLAYNTKTLSAKAGKV